MKKLLVLFCVLFVIQDSYSQTEIPEDLFQTWYLYYFTMPGEGEIMVNTLDIAQGPSFTINEDYTITGNTFCNDFGGLFEYIIYEDPFDPFTTFTPYDVVMTTNDCGTEAAYESRLYNAFLGGEEGEILALEEEFFVVQFPSSGYQGYRNTPVLSLQTELLNRTKIYPNPVSETLQISSNEIQLSSIEVLSLQGKVLTTEIDNLQEINLSHLSSGVYFIKLISEENSVIKKIIKN